MMRSKKCDAKAAATPALAASAFTSAWEQDFRVEYKKLSEQDTTRSRDGAAKSSSVPNDADSVNIGWEQNFRIEFQKQTAHEQKAIKGQSDSKNPDLATSASRRGWEGSLRFDIQQLTGEIVESIEILHPPSTPRGRNGLCIAGCFSRLACFDAEPEELELVKAKGTGKGAGKGKGKGKGKAPTAPPQAKAKPPAKAAGRQNSCPAPAWKPTAGMKSQRVVNWNPIRQEGLLEGSVWQRVNQAIEKRQDTLLPKEALNKAFMCSVAKASSQRPKAKPKSFSGAPRRKSDAEKGGKRILQAKKAFMADVLHCQLAKSGLSDLERLCKVLGVQSSQSTVQQPTDGPQPAPPPLPQQGTPSLKRTNSESSISSSSSESHSESNSESDSSDSESSSGGEEEPDRQKMEREESEEVSEESLQTLMNFLQLADGVEGELKASAGDAESKVPLAPSEYLMQQLVLKGGPASLLRSRVQATLTFSTFSKQADDLEKVIRSGMQAAKAVLDSTSIPLLLEGVLLLGNYVNSSSQQLGEASGVTLESIAKLANTRALAEPQKNGGMKEPQSAFHVLVFQMQASQGPTWLSELMSELEKCRGACDVEATISSSMKDLDAKVKDAEKCYYPYNGCPEPPASVQARFRRFMAYATSRLATVRSLEEDLVRAAAEMRRYFAEPDSTSLCAMMRSLTSLLEVMPTQPVDSSKSQSRSASKQKVLPESDPSAEPSLTVSQEATS